MCAVRIVRVGGDIEGLRASAGKAACKGIVAVTLAAIAVDLILVAAIMRAISAVPPSFAARLPAAPAQRAPERGGAAAGPGLRARRLFRALAQEVADARPAPDGPARLQVHVAARVHGAAVLRDELVGRVEQAPQGAVRLAAHDFRNGAWGTGRARNGRAPGQMAQVTAGPPGRGRAHKYNGHTTPMNNTDAQQRGRGVTQEHIAVIVEQYLGGMPSVKVAPQEVLDALLKEVDLRSLSIEHL